jgi:outer membrane protein TolC
LNTPTPLNNFSSRLGGTWNLFDSLASRRSLKRAERMDDASKNQLDRTEQEIVSRVVDSYYNVLLAKKALDVADQALKTAQAILERSKNRFESGLSVESDLLSATVRAAARREEQIRARNNLELARAQLSTAMGLSTQGGFEPQDVLAERNFSMDSVDARPDLKHLRATEAAQDQSVTIAKYSFGPRVNAFGSWELDNPTFFPGGGGNNWIAGVEVQFDLFQGGAKRAQLTQQKAMKEKIAAIKESASDEVRLEVRRAYYDVDSARQQIEVARATVQQSAESLRIIENRYEAGLLTITDLLSAEEAAHRSQTDYWDAVYRYHTGYAHLELATGTLNPQSPVVNP